MVAAEAALAPGQQAARKSIPHSLGAGVKPHLGKSGTQHDPDSRNRSAAEVGNRISSTAEGSSDHAARSHPAAWHPLLDPRLHGCLLDYAAVQRGAVGNRNSEPPALGRYAANYGA